MKSEVFMMFQYWAQFRRRRGWFTKPVESVRIILKDAIFELREITVLSAGSDEDLVPFEALYQVTVSYGKLRFRLPTVMPGPIPIPKPIRMRPGKQCEVELRGSPFKTTKGLSCLVVLSGVKVYGTRNSASPDSTKEPEGPK